MHKDSPSFMFGYDRFVLLIPFLLWCLLPALSFSVLGRLAVVIGLGGYLALVIVNIIVKQRYVVRKISIVLLIVLGYMWVTNLLFSPPEYRLRHLHFSVFLLISIVALHVLSANQKTAKLLLGITMVANAITLLLSIKALTIDHSIARVISESSEESKMLSARGLAGYGIVYANVVMLPVFIGLYRSLSAHKARHIVLFSLTSLNVVLCVVFLIKSQYTIALIIAFLTLTIALARRNLRITILLIIGMLFFLSTTSFFADIGTLLKLLEGTRYKEKLLDVIAAYSGTNESYGAVGSRSSAYLMSVSTFKDNILLGLLAFGKGIGHHSDIIDKFAQWGILVGCAVIYLICYCPVYLKRKLKDEISFEVGLVLISILLIGLLNTITMELSVPLVMLSCVFAMNRSQLYGR